MSGNKAFLTLRVDAELKQELAQGALVEHRSLSSFTRLLLEYAWGQYLKAGSIRELLSQHDKQRVMEDD